MPDAASLTVFVLAALALLLVPGPAVLYIIARSVDQGRNAGLVSVVGVGLGSMVHVGAAALGLSALLVQSAVAFRTVKYLGAAYLIYLGIRRLIGRGDDIVRADGSSRSLRRIFIQGVWVNILNPKTALFFFAFLPQFVNVDAGSVGLQILFLGTLLVTMGIVTDGAYAIAAGSLGDWLKKRPRVVTAQRWFAGGVFISLGLATALSGGKD
ncbi:MAG: LysE family translocator [Acidimicrobiia bacterium]|nr:LysE family translocator [Acidimicrobiia bacterium]